jgi:Kdo2-lipid IVA lauroyltransferase/acyltransferase
MKKLWRNFRMTFEVGLFRLGLLIVPRLPRRWVLALARGAGCVAYRVARRDRRIALANLDLAYGNGLSGREKAAIARQAFTTFARMLLDSFWFGRKTAERLRRYVEVEESLAVWLRGGPFVGVTAHFGNWEIMGEIAALSGARLASVVKPIRNPSIDGRLNRLRQRTGQRAVARAGALRTLVRHLKEGGSVALVLDQDTRVAEGGVFVSFFGVPVPMSNAAAILAPRMNAPIVAAFCKALDHGRYRCYARPPLMPDALRSLTPEQITQRIAEFLEAEIRSDPGQWLWMYKRWKRKQPGFDPAQYPFYADS